MLKVGDKVKLRVFLAKDKLLHPSPDNEFKRQLKDATVVKVISDQWFTVECRGVEYNVGFENLEGFDNDTEN